MDPAPRGVVVSPQASAQGARVFPAGNRFAFTILDDTDDATTENVRPIYDLLYELGFRTTKTTWPLGCPEGSRLFFAAETLEDGEYLAFVRELVERGFEIAFHGATMESSTRERTLRGLEAVRELLGVRPRIHCNHGQNRENLYWGGNRYRSRPLRPLMRMLHKALRRERYEGEDPTSPYFWGDLARAEFDYVRSFAFQHLNTAQVAPGNPYRLRSTPWANAWFVTSDAPDAAAFKRLVTRRSIDALHAAGAYCILSTHLGKRFVKNGRIDPQVEDSLRYMATLPGWFVPVSTLLDELRSHGPVPVLGPLQQFGLEARHLADRLSARKRQRVEAVA
jgi:hypothetical protein